MRKMLESSGVKETEWLAMHQFGTFENDQYVVKHDAQYEYYINEDYFPGRATGRSKNC